MKSAPRSETLLLSINIRSTVEQNRALSTAREQSTFSIFRKNLSVLVAALSERPSRLIVIPKRNKIEKDVYLIVPLFYRLKHPLIERVA